MKTIIHIIKKEFWQFKRDPKMFGLVLLAPVFQLIFLGYAVNMDVENVSTVVFDQDRSIESRKYIESFTSSGYFDLYDHVTNYNDLQSHIENGDAILGIVIPPDFDSKINRRETVRVQAILDGSDGNKGAISAGYVANITNRFASNIIADFRHKSGMSFNPVGSIEAETRAWYNPTLKTRIFMVPGIVGLLLSIITLVLTSLAVVKEKEIGTLEQIIVTPIKPFQLMIGKLIPFAILGFATVTIVLTAMALIFGIIPRGSILFLFGSSFLYILSTLGLGLFISTISKSQQQAMMLAMFLVMMPMVFLSGFSFPIENMPEVLQWVSYIIPLSYFMTIIRAVILKGAGFADLWFELSALLAIGIIILSLSALRFSRRLD
jgi:ABC-2 type transport system permease protein